MAESPSTMSSVQHIQELLAVLVARENHQTKTLTAIQIEILTAIKDVKAAIKDLENAIEGLHSTYRSMHEESAENVPVDNSDQSPALRLPLPDIPTQDR